MFKKTSNSRYKIFYTRFVDGDSEYPQEYFDTWEQCCQRMLWVIESEKRIESVEYLHPKPYLGLVNQD